MKLVTLANGKSIAPAFNLFTDVPIPGRHWFIIIDDLNFSSNPKSITFGEKAGMPFVPVGIYDYTDRLVTTVESDYNGLADVLLPSTNRISCPTPSGVCANLYRYVGNDPGVPGRLNLNYNPLFRTIAAEFEVLPGLLVPADLAPTQVGVTVQLPGAQTTSPVMCMLDDTTPQLYAVNQPYANVSGNTRSLGHDHGPGLRRDQGQRPGHLERCQRCPPQRGATPRSLRPFLAARPGGPQQLLITAANGQSTVNGLTFHVIGRPGPALSDYNPKIYEVGPGRTYAPAETLPAAANHAIQRALDAAATFIAASNANSDRGALVVVYPNNPSAQPAPEPARRVLREPDHHQQGQAAGRRPGQPRRRGARLDHRRCRLRRRQPGGDRLVHPHPQETTWTLHRQRDPELGRQSDHLRRRGDLDLRAGATGNASTALAAVPSRRRTPPTRRPRSTASTCAAATSRASPATSTPSAAGPPACPAA